MSLLRGVGGGGGGLMRGIKIPLYNNTSLWQKCRGGGLCARGGVFAGHYGMYMCYTGIFFLILELNRLIVALDAVAEKALSSSDSFIPERKKRIIADIPSSLKPPPDAPGWAIKPDCRTNDKGNLLYLNFV